MAIFVRLICAWFLFCLLGCSNPYPENKWIIGFYYPNGNYPKVIKRENFKSGDDCLAWAKKQAKNLTDKYLCGWNCMESEGGPAKCQIFYEDTPLAP